MVLQEFSSVVGSLALFWSWRLSNRVDEDKVGSFSGTILTLNGPLAEFRRSSIAPPNGRHFFCVRQIASHNPGSRVLAIIFPPFRKSAHYEVDLHVPPSVKQRDTSPILIVLAKSLAFF